MTDARTAQVRTTADLHRGVSARRRLQGAVGMGIVGLGAAGSVAVLAWLLFVILLRGSRYVFRVDLATAPAAALAAVVGPAGLPVVIVLAVAVLAAAAGLGLGRLVASRGRGPAATPVAGQAATVVRVAGGFPLGLLAAALALAALLLGGIEAYVVGAAAAVLAVIRIARTPVPVSAGAQAKLKAEQRAALRWLAAVAIVAIGVRILDAFVNRTFLDNYSVPEYIGAEHAGIKAAIAGTLWLGGVSMAFAIPVGILAAIYLNEFAPTGRITAFLRASIANLAGVPSVVFGMLGLALFVYAVGLGRSVAAAGLTLGILTLPIVIVVSEEALKSVPRAMREAAFGLGATRWQAVRHHVLPYSLPGMLTGSILALSRTLGETAPLIVIGAATIIPFTPDSPLSSFTAVPIQAYYWADSPNTDFQALAWGAVFVLISIVLAGNLLAILLRDRFQRKYRW